MCKWYDLFQHKIKQCTKMSEMLFSSIKHNATILRPENEFFIHVNVLHLVFTGRTGHFIGFVVLRLI